MKMQGTVEALSVLGNVKTDGCVPISSETALPAGRRRVRLSEAQKVVRLTRPQGRITQLLQPSVELELRAGCALSSGNAALL